MIRVTVTDVETGDSDSCELGDGPDQWVLTCGPGCEMSHVQKHANGTVQLTIKPTAGATDTTCPTCGGTGKLPDYEDPDRGLIYRPCPYCDAGGAA